MDQRAITDKACLFVIVGVASHEAGMEMIPDIQRPPRAPEEQLRTSPLWRDRHRLRQQPPTEEGTEPPTPGRGLTEQRAPD